MSRFTIIRAAHDADVKAALRWADALHNKMSAEERNKRFDAWEATSQAFLKALREALL